MLTLTKLMVQALTRKKQHHRISLSIPHTQVCIIRHSSARPAHTHFSSSISSELSLPSTQQGPLHFTSFPRSTLSSSLIHLQPAYSFGKFFFQSSFPCSQTASVYCDPLILIISTCFPIFFPYFPIIALILDMLRSLLKCFILSIPTLLS